MPALRGWWVRTAHRSLRKQPVSLMTPPLTTRWPVQSIPSGMVSPADASSKPPSSCWSADACFSSCGRYRWLLHRALVEPLPTEDPRTLIFVGLNPSRAGAHRDDPTLRRLIAFGTRWRYHRLVVVNLFARISPSPGALQRCSDPVGDRTDAVLQHWMEDWADHPSWDLWLGWGTRGALFQRDQAMLAKLEPALQSRRAGAWPLTLGSTRSGQPRHPLYVPGDRVPTPWACTVR